MGCLHIYCGDGKGKTTAAIGLAVRMAGSGGRVVVARFLKNDASGEVSALRQIEGIEVLPCEKTFGFTWQMTDTQRAEAAEYYTELFDRACMRVQAPIAPKTEVRSVDVKQAVNHPAVYGRHLDNCDVLLVFDELCAAVDSGFIEVQRVVDFLDARPENLEVVVTGRNPSEELLKRADYISEIKKGRHPLDRGLTARKGIEY